MTSNAAVSPRDELVEEYDVFARQIVRRLISTMGLPFEMHDELMSAAYLGLVEAASRYDGREGVEFKFYAYLRIKGSIIDSIRETAALPRRAYRSVKAMAAVQSLREEMSNGFRQGTKPEQLEKLYKLASKSLLARRLSLSDISDDVAPLDEKETPDKVIERRSRGIRLRELVKKLPEREQRIIEKYYFEDQPFFELMKDDPNLSKSWISRLHSKALDKLKKLIEEDGGRDGF